MEKILKDRYYLGYVIWKGKEYKGSHQPLVEPKLFSDVQDVLARRNRGTRQHIWKHYLKGLRPHFYFRCTRLQGDQCDLPRFRLEAIERAVEDHYTTIAISEAERTEIRGALHTDPDRKTKESHDHSHGFPSSAQRSSLDSSVSCVV